MEQRALLASALVLGCVTAASAGGYLAMRQADAPAAVDAASQAVATDGGTALAEGTVADIAVPGEPVEPTRQSR